MSDDLPIADGLYVCAADLRMQTSRSGGPGGQSVNTADTRVQLFFALDRCETLPYPVKERLRQKHKHLVTGEGELVLACGRNRSRLRNVEEVRDRLAEMIRGCLRAPPKRTKTKPSRSAKRERLDKKKQRGTTKKMRGRVQDE